MAPKKGPQERVEARSALAAVLLADSFTQRFRPITVQRPKVLLPLVNVPMIEYTLEWLSMNKVEEVYVFCCAHADQIKKYLSDSKWGASGGMRVTTIVSTNCLSAGEALRAIDQRDIIKSDFILVSGDTVSNMNLKPVLEEHRARRAADKNAIMTMVMKPVRQHAMQRLRMGSSDLIVSIDPATHRLLKYHESDPQRCAANIKIDAAFFSERDCVQVRTDLLDSQISICAPEVLMLFSDNFDYQNVKQDFVTGVLSEEELGNKLYVHELTTEYAAHIHNLRSYDAVSRDIIQRWCFPFVPDTNVLFKNGTWGASSYRYGRSHVYTEQQVQVQRSAQITNDACIGAGTSIGEGSRISMSVIGRNCRIGKGAQIHGSYLQDDVTVQDGAVLRCALVCEGATLGPGAVLEPGAIVSYGVVIGARHQVPANTRVSLCQQIHNEAVSDDELEYTAASTGARTPHRSMGGGGRSDGDNSDDDESSGSGMNEDDGDMCGSLEKPTEAAIKAALALAAGRAAAEQLFDESVVGANGAGYVWRAVEGFDVERFSIAPPKTTESAVAIEADQDAEPSAQGKGGPAGNGAGSESGSDEGEPEEETDPETIFKREVAETFLRCVKMRFDQTNAVIELNGLKIAEDRSFADCARYIFTTMLGLCLPAPPRVAEEYGSLFQAQAPNSATQEGKLALLKLFKKQLTEWGPLLQRFLRNEDDQVEVLLTLEEFCSEEGVFEGTGEQGSTFRDVFPQVLQQMYEADVISEEAFMAWADEKQHADENDRAYLTKASKFIEWLRTADDDDSEEESDEESD